MTLLQQAEETRNKFYIEYLNTKPGPMMNVIKQELILAEKEINRLTTKGNEP